MTFANFLPLLASVVLLVVGVYAYASGARDRLHRLFFVACAVLAYWAFATFELLTAGTLEAARFWAHAAFPWPFGFALLLHLSLVVGANRAVPSLSARTPRARLSRGVGLALLYLPAIGFAVLDLLTDRITGLPWRTTVGWTVTPLYTEAGPVAVAWAVGIAAIAAIASLVRFVSRRGWEGRRRSQRACEGLFLAGFAFALLAMLIVDGILPFYRTGYQEWIAVGLALGALSLGAGVVLGDRGSLSAESAATPLLAIAPCLLSFLDEHGRIVAASRSMAALLGYPEGGLRGVKAIALLAPGPNRPPDRFWRQLTEDGLYRDALLTLRNRNGERMETLFSFAVVRRAHILEGYVCAGVNVTGESLARDELSNILREKDLLVREAYHRIKNNLAIVGSLINLYQEQVNDPTGREIMAALRARVRSISLVHEQLHQSHDLSTVDFASYARKLLDNIRSSFLPPGVAVELITLIEPARLSVDVAVTLGLILTELATNALKHGFTGVSSGEIRVSMGRQGASHRLTFSNSGPPIPDLDAALTDSLGLGLVRALVDQLDGTIGLTRKPETTFLITIPAEE